MNLTPGNTINKGKYILDTQIGTGVFSLTYRATSKSGQTVILKTIADNLCQHPDFDKFKQQFLWIAQRLRRCQHPHLVSVVDYFVASGRPYLVMEYIPGQTLAAIIQAQALPEKKALEYIHQLSDALSHLHQAGLLHRDIKPENIIRRQDSDCVVLCELGITCELTPGAMQTHASLLSSGYVPPEQYSPEYKRTKATDIYALAATFYCLLTGHPPLPVPVRKVLQTGDSDCLLPSDLQQFPPQISSKAMQAIKSGLELAIHKRPQTVEAWLSPLHLPNRLVKEGDAEIRGQGNNPRLKSKDTLLSSPSTQLASAQSNEYGTQAVTGKGNIHPNLRRTKITPSKVNTKANLKLYPLPTVFQLIPTKAKAFGLKLTPKKVPLKALLMTGAIAASAGVGFGFALRFNSPDTAGSTILHTEQSFPPRTDWPVSEPSL